MSILAIAEVYNTEEVANEKGWKQGYRLIGTEDKQILDASKETIYSWYTDGEIEVANMTYNDIGVTVEPIEDNHGIIRNIPSIEVDMQGARIINSTKNKSKGSSAKQVFIVNYSISDFGTYTCVICDCLGDVREVAWHCLSRYCDEGKVVAMNGYGAYNGKPEPTGATVTEAGINTRILNESAQEHLRREKFLGASAWELYDLPISDGIYLARVNTSTGDTVYIPDYIEEIGYGALSRLESLDSIILGKGVKRIWTRGLADLHVRSIRLNEGLERIDSAAFAGTIVEEPLVIPASVKHIGEYAFHPDIEDRIIMR